MRIIYLLIHCFQNKRGANMKAEPLKSSFTLIAIIGLIVSVIYLVYDKISPTWGVTLIVIFGAMLVAAFISMHKSSFPKFCDIHKNKCIRY